MNFAKLCKKPVLAHVMGWHGPSSGHLLTPDSASPWQIERDLQQMQTLGIAGVICNWRGRAKTIQHESTRLYAYLTARCNMKFAVMLDSMTNEQAVTEMTAAKDIFSTPSYVPERLVLLWDGFDATKLPSGYSYVPRHSGYTWPEVKQLDPVAFQLTEAGQKTLPAIWSGFNDARPSDPTKGVWPNADGTIPSSRVVHDRYGDLLLQTCAAVPDSALYAQLVTWDDYEEGTAFARYAKWE